MDIDARPARKVCGWLAAVVLGLFHTPLASAQSADAVNPQAYANAVDAYITGRDLVETVSGLKVWTRKDFEAAVERLISERNIARMEAAAVFQLEIGLGAISISPAGAQLHFELGEKILKSLTPTPAELRVTPERREEVRRLFSTWLGVAASGYLWITDTGRAWPWIRKALQMAPESASLRVIEGSAHEIDAGSYDASVPRSGDGSASGYFPRLRRLALAEEAFRMAVDAAPLYAPAHIRLGRISFLLDKFGQAEQQVRRGEALASRPDDRYLAALFLGAISEKQKDMAGAREFYTKALTIAPRSQTATVALAHLDLISGRPDRAQSLARAFAAAPVDDHAWWAYKNGGIDQDGLVLLRKRVRK